MSLRQVVATGLALTVLATAAASPAAMSASPSTNSDLRTVRTVAAESTILGGHASTGGFLRHGEQNVVDVANKDW